MLTSATLAAVNEQERKAKELEAKVAELTETERDLAGRIAEGLAEGADVTRLQAQRAEAVALRRDIESVLPILRQKIDERRELASRGEAARRPPGIGRGSGSLRSSYDADLVCIERLAGEWEAAVEKLNARYASLRVLDIEALFLLDRWPDLNPPVITRVDPPALQPRAVAALDG